MIPFVYSPMPYILVLDSTNNYHKLHSNSFGNSYKLMSIRYKVLIHILSNQPTTHNQNIVTYYKMHCTYEIDGSNEVRSICNTRQLSYTLTSLSQHHILHKLPYRIPHTKPPCCNRCSKPFHSTCKSQFLHPQNNQSKGFSCTDSKLYQ